MERDRRTQPQGFPALESRARVHSLIQVGGEGLPFRGGDVGLRRSKGSGPTARALDGSGCPGCWHKPLVGHFLHLQKRRMGRKAGQGR